MYLHPHATLDSIRIPTNFRGLDPNLPVRIYHRHLPHYRQEGATYFITFRQRDAIPAQLTRQLARETDLWRGRFAEARVDRREDLSPELQKEFEEYQRAVAMRVEVALDAGTGTCRLARAGLRAFLCDALLHFDGARVDMFAFVVMPNHAHVLCRPQPPQEPEQLTGSWKRHSAVRIQRAVGESGALWQEESWDRIVRDEDHFRRVLRYIVANPARARVPVSRASLWVMPDLMAPISDHQVGECSAPYGLDPW